MTHHKRTLRIIVASKEASLRRILSHSFEGLGAQVEEVCSHQRLIGKLQHHRYDIILTRFTLPILDNRQWATLMRGKPRATQLWVIADSLTAEESVALIERGANQIFSLPVSVTRLKNKLKKAISKATNQC